MPINIERLIESISQLSDDPEQAFFEYEEQRRSEMEENRNSSNWAAERVYVDQLKVFTEVFGENNYVVVGEIPPSDDSFKQMYLPLVQEIDRAKLKFSLRKAFRAKEESDRVIILTDESKTAIRALIEAIKIKLDAIAIAEPKRRALLSKLNSFLNELDQNLTHTEAFFSFAVQAARAVREAGAEFKPMADRIDRVLDLIDEGKKWVESLPGFRKPKQLEAPPKQIEDHSKSDLE